MTHGAEFAQWYYLVFLLPGLLAVLLLLTASAFSLGGGDADADSDADMEADSDLDIQADGDTDVEADGDAAEGGFGANVLRLAGADRAPLSLVGGVFFLGWGFFGFWATEFLAPVLKAPLVFIGPSVFAALLGALLLARTAATVSHRVMPKTATAAVRRASLVGKEARVVYPISAAGGRAFHYDQRGVLHDLTCRVRAGDAVIPKGKKIILAGYDPESRRFWAEVSPFGDD